MKKKITKELLLFTMIYDAKGLKRNIIVAGVVESNMNDVIMKKKNRVYMHTQNTHRSPA